MTTQQRQRLAAHLDHRGYAGQILAQNNVLHQAHFDVAVLDLGFAGLEPARGVEGDLNFGTFGQVVVNHQNAINQESQAYSSFFGVSNSITDVLFSDSMYRTSLIPISNPQNAL